jgi:hypothetical protein
VTSKLTTEQNWQRQSEAAKADAQNCPTVKNVMKAQQLEAALQMVRWISSPGQKPPE